jgi:ERCC4-type nuclease
MATLIIDTRERDLIRETTKRSFKTQSLPVGDIWISFIYKNTSQIGEEPPQIAEETPQIDNSNSKVELVIERKSHADLFASLKDGRWREQKARLLTHCSQIGAHPVYIVEGSMQFLDSQKTSILRKLMNRLQFRYGIKVIQTDDLADTASIILTIAEQMEADPDAFMAPTSTKQYYENVQVSKKANKEDPANFARTVLMQCPGISATFADAILRHAGPRLADVFTRDEKTLASISVSEKRKVGPAVAKRLLGLWNSSSQN